MSKIYQYQTPRERYMGDRRQKHDPKRVDTYWNTQFETTDYNIIEKYIAGKDIVSWEADGTPIYNEKDDVYRVLVVDVHTQQGEIHSAWEEWQQEINAKLRQKLKHEEVA